MPAICPGSALQRISVLPTTKVLSVLSARWTLSIIDAVAAGRTRFNDLHRHLEGINHKVLIETLRLLQRDGYLHGPLTRGGARASRDVVPYQLTDLGLRLREMAEEIRQWSEHHAGLIEQARDRFDGRPAAN